MDVDKLIDTADEKACLAHEMGHALPEASIIFTAPATFEVSGRPAPSAGPSAHLVPTQELAEAVEAGFTEPWELAEYFGVPEPLIRQAEELYACTQ